MPILAKKDRFRPVLIVAAAMLLIGGGCCGPMACGPVGCGGPVILGGNACGDSCNGCGERYFDEWINHPPSCCDPCDSCGNHDGQSGHTFRPILSGFPSIWGYRCDPPPTGCDRVACEPACGIESCDGGCGSGCGSCGGDRTIHHQHHPLMEVGPTPLSAKHRKPTHSQVAHVATVKSKPKSKNPDVQRNNGHR